MTGATGYRYFGGTREAACRGPGTAEGALRLGDERLNPRLSNPDFLVLRVRRQLLTQWIGQLKGDELSVLDVGGRIQPYRPLLGNRVKRYVAVDPQLEGLVDAIAMGECLPFADGCFDIVICTQVLGYVSNPEKVVAEMHRVLRLGGMLLLSAPAFFPRHHDERWRFLPDGLRTLLARFSCVEVAPEGYSITGFFRTMNVCLNSVVQSRLLRRLMALGIVPVLNIAGVLFDKMSRGNEQMTANYSVMALK